MAITRLEKNGKVAFSDGKTTLVVPSEDACRERLTAVLALAPGEEQILNEFWKERAKEMGDLDELKRAWATETWLRLDKIWNELVAPTVVPDEEDFFAGFE